MFQASPVSDSGRILSGTVEVDDGYDRLTILDVSSDGYLVLCEGLIDRKVWIDGELPKGVYFHRKDAPQGAGKVPTMNRNVAAAVPCEVNVKTADMEYNNLLANYNGQYCEVRAPGLSAHGTYKYMPERHGGESWHIDLPFGRNRVKDSGFHGTPMGFYFSDIYKIEFFRRRIDNVEVTSPRIYLR